jgi:outer membrane protein
MFGEARRGCGWVPLCWILAAAGGAARAETLADAIATAYATNPTLQAQRAQQGVTDESYVQAKAGWRPDIRLEASAGYSRTPQSDPFFGTQMVSSNSAALALSLNQTLYSGGRTLSAVKAAKADVLAGRERLRSVEGSVLSAVVADYAAVRLTDETVEIRRRYVAALQGHLDETRARQKAGDLTRTDVAQTEAQLAAASQLLNDAQAQKDASRAAYAAVVGQAPGATLEAPPMLPGLPKTVDEAFEISEANNPDLAHAQLAEKASSERIAQARAARRPTVSLQASAGYLGPLTPFQPRNELSEMAVQAVLVQPLYAGGAIDSGVHQAVAQNSVDRIEIEAVRRSVDQAVTQAWSAWLAAKQNLTAAQAGLTAAQAATTGARIEYRNGLRTTLDVLLSEEALQNAELALAQANRDRLMAETAILAAEGNLTAAGLLANAKLYDPAAPLAARRRATEPPTDLVAALLDSLGEPSDAKRSKPPGVPITDQPTLRSADTASPVADGGKP